MQHKSCLRAKVFSNKSQVSHTLKKRRKIYLQYILRHQVNRGVHIPLKVTLITRKIFFENTDKILFCF